MISLKEEICHMEITTALERTTSSRYRESRDIKKFVKRTIGETRLFIYNSIMKDIY